MMEYVALEEWYWQGKTEVLLRKISPSTTVSTTNPTLTGLKWNPDIRSQRPATKRLSHGTASELKYGVNFTS
jgi:hypothetical protein